MSDSIINLLNYVCVCTWMKRKLNFTVKIQRVLRQNCSVLRQGWRELPKCLIGQALHLPFLSLELIQSLMFLTQRQLEVLGGMDVAETLPLGILLKYCENYFEFCN